MGYDQFSHGAAYVKLLDCRNTAVITLANNVPPTEPRIERINEDFYYVPSCCDIRPYKKSDKPVTRGDNVRSIKRAFSNLKALINCNYDQPENIKYVTLTYAENMQDKKRLSRDMAYFLKKMKKEYGHFEYIYVVEKQGRGAWHVHALWFFEGKAPFIPHDDLRDKWGHGIIVNVQDIRDDLNNVGNYLCAYFTDDEETGKKGSRLMNYESGVRLYRCSKGIKRPEKKVISFEEFQELIGSDTTSLLSQSDVTKEVAGKVLTYRYMLISKE